MPPSEFVATTAPGFEGDACRELRRHLPGVDARKLPMCGNVRFASPLSREETLDVLRAAPTYVLASVVPVGVELRVDKSPDSLEPLKHALPWNELFAGAATFVIRCRRRGHHDWDSRDLKRGLGMFLEETTGAEARLVGETDIEVGVDVYQGLCFLGVYPPSQRLVKTLRIHRKYAPGERPLNRAELKLREALTRFDIALQPQWRALDIGASPGGWTKVLAETVAEVVAVDPADLDPAVAALPNVRHLRRKAEDVAPDEIGPVDILVNDMNIDGDASAAVLCAVAHLLRPGAPAVMTVKFMSRRWRQQLQDAKRALAPAYDVIQVCRLPHNRSEATLFLQRKPID